MTRVSDIDWTCWKPTDRATLLFVIKDGKVLLIHKKRGLGAGKINGPGGRIEPGEAPRDCAVREVKEELCITVLNAHHAGNVKFQFMDGYSIEADVFTATDYEGTPMETDEAIPHWFDIDRLPFDRMWPDDELWMPHLFAGRPFTGRFVFDGDTMLDAVVLHDPAP